MITQPSLLSTMDIHALPELVLLADAANALFDLAHIAALTDLVRRSHEHTYTLTQYAKDAIPGSLAAFERYGASAFDEGTVQDLKYHREAGEIYLALTGTFSILWKVRGQARIERARALHVSAGSSPWAFIPDNFCLLVDSQPNSSFLAVAFKTKESNLRNGGKQVGKGCAHYQDQTCPHCQECEELNANRARFFDTIKVARTGAVQHVQGIARQIP